MADYFTNFSLIVSLPNEAAQQYAVDLATQGSQVCQGDEKPDDFPDVLMDVVEDWQFEADPELHNGKFGIWLHSENGGIDAVCAYIQHLLQKYGLDDDVSFEWSNDCSKPRTDAYGGGAAVITASKIKTMNTYQWIIKQTRRLNPVST
jgi:hypothetical protein